jgi:beta-glucosidase
MKTRLPWSCAAAPLTDQAGVCQSVALKTMKALLTILRILTVIVLTGSPVGQARAATTAPSAGSSTVALATNVTNATDAAAGTMAETPNTAIVPVSRDGRALNRQNTVLQRARDNQGPCDIVFIGDSITQGWEVNGTNVWERYYGNRKCLNLGVGGDRTQHVIWRFENGQLDGLDPKAAVLLIGTNNSNRDDNSEAEILEGVLAVVKQIRERLPDTRLLVVGIFPRGQTFSAQRGKVLQVNQALAKVADGKMIYYIDFGSDLIEPDGSLSRDIMPDYLHLSERGYAIWAAAMEPILQELISAN